MVKIFVKRVPSHKAMHFRLRLCRNCGFRPFFCDWKQKQKKSGSCPTGFRMPRIFLMKGILIMTVSGDWGGWVLKKKLNTCKLILTLLAAFSSFEATFCCFLFIPVPQKATVLSSNYPCFLIFAYIYVESTGVLLKGFKTWVAKGYAW